MKMTNPITTKSIVQAAPGFNVLEPVSDPNGELQEPFFVRNPIVAWAIDWEQTDEDREQAESGMLYTHPVCIELEGNPGDPIKYPDGRIVFREDREFGPNEWREAREHLDQRQRRTAANT